MRKRILILQFRTDKSLGHERSCFLKSGFNKSDLVYINVLNNHAKLPVPKDLNKYKAIIMGGSGQVNISDWNNKIKNRILKIAPFIKEAVKQDTPMLNICFGHQLLTYILGGRVLADEKQSETGTFKISISKDAQIFRKIPASFYAIEGHKDSIVNLPSQAQVLASSDRCHIEAYKLKKNIYCVQFHPELDKEGLKFRMNLFPSYTKGKNVDEILKNYKPTIYASKVLNNFRQMVSQN